MRPLPEDALRLCIVCGEDISDRHWKATLCYICRDIRYPPKQSLPVRYCVDCNKQIGVNALPETIRCGRCRASKYSGPPNSPQKGAGVIVMMAVQSGILPKQDTQSCVDCGAVAEHYDHRDYMKPLDVDPVCRKCNFKRGPGLNRDY